MHCDQSTVVGLPALRLGEPTPDTNREGPPIVNVILLGTGGYHPNRRRQTACIAIPEAGIVLDAGTGLFRLRDHWGERDTIDILLTHAHLDHVIGLTFLFNTLHGHPERVVRVHGERDKLAAIEEHLWHPSLFPARPPCTLHPLEPKSLDHLAAKVEYFRLSHPGGTVGYRLDLSHGSLAYITDTMATADADYVAAIQGVDLLIHECYFPDQRRQTAVTTGHSWTSGVAHVAAKAEVGHLVLVHTDPLCDEDDPVDLAAARKIFPNTTLGEDEMTCRLGR